MFLSPLYLIMITPVFIFTIWAQWRVKHNFEKYSRYNTMSGYTGAQVADMILSQNGIADVKIEMTNGWLSDHYSPSEKVLRLSSNVYNSTSIAALGVAAHEAGHTIQHYKGYSIMQLWLALAKPAAFASNAAIWLLMIGFLLNMLQLAVLGFYFFMGAVIFQIITLPVEFDASRRAKELLFKFGIISGKEREGVAAVLNSAAMTYVAAAAASLVQLLYYAIQLGLLGGHRDD